MKKLSIPFHLAFCAFFLTTSFSILAQDASKIAVPVGPTTQITFAEQTIDFGLIEEGEIITQVFTFTNTGHQPLILTDAKGSCGCTVPQWPRQAIAVGETASITVEFNSKNKKGRRNQKVTITANTNPPQNFIYLTGDIKASPKTVEPSFDFTEIELEQAEENPNCFAIYPNPTAEILTLDMGDNEGSDAVVTILSQTGQVMAKREFKNVYTTVEFRVDHYPAGTYVAQVQFPNRKPETKCFVVLE
ncbi:MAG: DUF1573 domain-containing protein [Bacteroidota bacterium]